MSEQIAAHERFLRVRSDLNDALDRGDHRATRQLRAELKRAEREWHRLVRAAEDAMRHTRPR